MPDRIEKSVTLHAPRERVWNALIDRTQFGQWFGVRLQPGRFTAGEESVGNIAFPGYEHLVMRADVKAVEPERLLSWHWHPYAVDPTADYSHEPPTLVTFTLEESDGGTLLRVVESGFDAIPAARRDEAFTMNERGWDEQMRNLERHLGAS